MVKILTDSCSDLGKDIRTLLDIDYCKMNIVANGIEKTADLDWVEYSAKEMYDLMRHGERITTTQVLAVEFDSAFRKYAARGYDIIYIGCASPLSGSVNTGSVIASKVMEDYPNISIYCVDSVNSSLGEGMCAIKAAQLSKEGKTVQEIVAILDEYKYTINQYCTVNTLDYLKRAGRISASSAFFGNLFGVKPVIISTEEGQNLAIEKVKGRSTSMKTIVAKLKEVIIDSVEQTIYVSHADCEEEANQLVEIIKNEIKCKNIYVNCMGPIIGASVGPGALAVFGCGKSVKEYK